MHQYIKVFYESASVNLKTCVYKQNAPKLIYIHICNMKTNVTLKMNGKCHTGNGQVKDAKKGKLEDYDWT